MKKLTFLAALFTLLGKLLAQSPPLFQVTPDTACSPATFLIHLGPYQGISHVWLKDEELYSTSPNPGGISFTSSGTHTIRLNMRVVGNEMKCLMSDTFWIYSLPGCYAPGLEIFEGNPDVYLVIKSMSGKEVYRTHWRTMVPPSTDKPMKIFPINSVLHPDSSYRLEVWDYDTGLGFADDFLGSSFINCNKTTDTVYIGCSETPLIFSFKVTQDNYDFLSHSVKVYVSLPTASATVKNDAGAGGSIKINSISNGIPPYQLQWSNGATGMELTNLPVGTYTVTITDSKGCTGTKNFTVSKCNLTANVSATNVLCAGGANGSATVTTANGTSPYTYVWSNGGNRASITNLTAGTYTVTVTDGAGCTAIGVVHIAQPTAISAQIETKDLSCPDKNDGVVGLSVTGGTPPYIYNWSNGGTDTSISNLTPGTYTCTVTDANSCTAVFKGTVAAPQPPMVNLIGANTACADTGIWVYTVQSPDLANLTWNISANGTITSGQGTNEITVDWTATGPGIVELVYTWGQNCKGTAVLQVGVKQCISSLSEPHLAGVYVLPNPFQQHVYVRFERPLQAGAWVRLTSANGQIIAEQKLTDENTLLHTGHLPAGIYLLQVVENGQTGVWRLVKTE